MHPVAKFLIDFLVIIWLIIKATIYAFIPNSVIFKDLKGETVLVTGGGAGVGQQLALKLAALGCSVVVWDINEKGGQKTVKSIRDIGGIAHFYLCDVSKRKQVYATASKVKREVGQVSILVNNAAIVSAKPVLTCPDEMIEKTFQVNTLSHFWTCKAFLPDMITKNHGHIVTVASIAGYVPLYHAADYCASKSGVISLHECLPLEFQKSNSTGIKTTVVLPYHIKTELFKGFETRLFSSIEPEYVADKIKSAIRRNAEAAFIPGYLNFLVMLKSLLPLPVCVQGVEMAIGSSAMDNVGNDTKEEATYSVQSNESI